MEQAYQLADVYIRECEKLQKYFPHRNLVLFMLIDFTERVSQNKIPQGMSLEIFECIQFITHHINESIRVGDVAETYRKKPLLFDKQVQKRAQVFDVQLHYAV